MNMHRDASRLTGVVLFAVVAAVAAQDPIPSDPPVGAAPSLQPLDRLLSATVFVTDAAAEEEGDDAAAREKHVGVVSNLVIDTLAQRITWAAVQTGEGVRAVPYTSLKFDSGRHGWMLVGGKEELANARSFEATNLDELHETAAPASRTKDSDPGKDDKGRDGSRDAKVVKTTSASTGRYLLATDCAKRDVVADDGRFATAVGLVLETDSGTPAFLRLAASGGDVAVPWAALKSSKPTAPGDRDAFWVAMTKSRMDTAPRLSRDGAASLDDRAFRDKLYEFFGVAAPPFETPNPLRRN